MAAGAQEIDIVITRAHVFSGNWKALYAEISEFRKACGNAHLKTILGTGELGTFRNVAKASLVCMMAGADFIKTSTGKESVNATLPVSLVMLRMIREYFEKIYIDEDDNAKDYIVEQGFKTVPQIWLDDKWIGGYDDFILTAFSLQNDNNNFANHLKT